MPTRIRILQADDNVIANAAAFSLNAGQLAQAFTDAPIDEVAQHSLGVAQESLTNARSQATALVTDAMTWTQAKRENDIDIIHGQQIVTELAPLVTEARNDLTQITETLANTTQPSNEYERLREHAKKLCETLAHQSPLLSHSEASGKEVTSRAVYFKVEIERVVVLAHLLVAELERGVAEMKLLSITQSMPIQVRRIIDRARDMYVEALTIASDTARAVETIVRQSAAAGRL